MRYDHFSMLPERAFQRIGRRMTLEGGGGGSSSSTTQTTQNIDRRQVVGELGLGISSDTSSINVQVADQRALEVANQSVSKAITAVTEGDKLQQQGFGQLLDATRYMLGEVFATVEKNQALVGQVSSATADAYDTAQSAVSGNRDLQRYMVIGAVALLGFAYLRGRKG